VERLGLLEVLDRDARVRQVFEVTRWPLRVGRSLDCDIVLDDPHVAPEHLHLRPADGGVAVTVGNTINGVRCGRRQLRAGEEAVRPSGEEWWVGQTRVRLRLAADALPAELPLPVAGRWPVASLLLALAGVIGWTAWGEYLQSEPGDFLSGLAGAGLSVLAVLGAWSFLWALGSKLFQHRLDYWRHLRIAATGLVASGVVSASLGVLAFITSWVLLSRLSPAAEFTVLAATVWAHLAVVLPGRRRALGWVVGAALVAGLAVAAAFQVQRTGRLFGELYLTVLPPPSLRLAPAVPPSRFLDEARALQEPLDQAAREDADEGAPADEAEDTE
jgi:hypothetical protein